GLGGGVRWASRRPRIRSPTPRGRGLKTAEMGKAIPSLSLLACDLAIPMSVTAGAQRGARDAHAGRYRRRRARRADAVASPPPRWRGERHPGKPQPRLYREP